MEIITTFIINILVIGLGYFVVYKAFTNKLNKFNIKAKIIGIIGFDISCEYSNTNQKEDNK